VIARPSARRADVQGLRAIAVLMVVAFHAGLDVPGGFTGVDVFFVISGFVITAMLLREVHRDGRFSLAEFYARRVRRIMPASAVTIGVVAVLSVAAVNSSVHAVTAHTGIGGSLFTANVVLARAQNGYFDVAATTNPLLHIWTLSVEEQFYFVFPAIMLLGVLLSRRRSVRESLGTLATLIGVVAAVSFVVGWYTSTQTVRVPGFPSAAQFAFYMAPARAWEFAVGALVALGVPYWRRIPTAVAHTLAALGFVLVVLSAFAIDGTMAFPGTVALLPVGGAALLVVAGTRISGGIPGLLGWNPLTRIGDYSYSWYLWHWPLIVFAVALFPMQGNAAIIGAAVSIVPAWLSYRFVETPFRHDTRIRGSRAAVVALVCVAIPIALCAALLVVPEPSGSAATRALLRVSGQQHQTEARGCNRGVPYDALPPRCTWRVPASKGDVVLIGDSNAGHFVEPAARAANAVGNDLTVATYPDCPFVDLRISERARPGATLPCRRFVVKSLEGLETRRPKLVIIAASGPIYLTSATTFTDPTTGRVGTTAATKAQLWSAGLRRVLERLHAAHVPTVVVHTVPQWLTWDPRACADVRVYLAPRSCGADQTLAEVAAFRRDSLAADDRALRAVPGAVGVDFLTDLCDATCATNRGNFWVYKDGRHLSVEGALTLTRRFESIVREYARP